MSLPKKVTCPYCMKDFDNPEIERRKNKNKINPLATPPPIDICPKCGKRIPQDYLYSKVRTLYIYFIGPKNVGKTRLIGNMIIESERKFPHRGVFREWTAAPNPNPNPNKDSSNVNENEMRKFYENYAGDKECLPTGKEEIEKNPMVLYKLGSCNSILSSCANWSFGDEKIYIALADAMGEWFTFKDLPANTKDPFSVMPPNEYKERFSRADAIILIFEPGHIPGLYSVDDKDVNNNPIISNTDTDIEKILDYSQLLFGKRFQKIPLAITLSKFDSLYASKNPVAKEFLELFEKSTSSDWRNATDLEHDDIRKITEVNEGLKAAILGSKNILLNSRARKNIREIISSYPYASLFAVSSTGMEGLRGTKTNLSPLHVLDPLLWILWQYGYCESKLFA